MNRRALLVRLGAAVAFAPVASKVIQAPGTLILPEVKALPGPVGDVAALIEHRQQCLAEIDRLSNMRVQSPIMAAVGRVDRSLSLLRSRGLIDPCPNCKVDAWKATERDVVTCERCGWLDRRARFERPCQCDDCTWLRLRSPMYARNTTGPWKPAMRARILDDAPTGFYVVCDDVDHEMRRIERNVYDLNTDDWLHNVQQRQLARVLCGVYALNNPKDRSGIEQVQRPNGDLVFFQWENVDCYEWQRDREQGV